MNIVLSTAYFPPTIWFRCIANADKIWLEGKETYQKQSYRTRCYIDSSNGVLFLNLPIERMPNDRRFIRELKIDHSKPWISHHIRALVSSYNNTPFFEYYFYDDIEPILKKKHRYLFDLNLEMAEKLMELLCLDRKLQLTEDYFRTEEYAAEGCTDLRDCIHPKRELPLLENERGSLTELPHYYNIFRNEQNVNPNLSVLDLLFHEGPNSISFLLQR